uniref:Glycosyltransferase family 69 protein n=1 Tax=Podospora anserina (strain S / ATCC MYA-4624 / DSM 980 / FGSC 10383) TaxID=515849 RepID=A0A090CSH1_PODAN|nr:Putative protein of unknown function [Podospora anserina S mat+]
MMMVTPRCFSRATLVLLSVILSLLLFTALRVHNGIPPTVSITAAQSMVENLAGEWFHLDRQHPDKVSPFTPQADNAAEEPKPPELPVEGKSSRNLARPPELEYLRQEKFGLTDTILYTQQCIKPVYDKTVDRNLVSNITTPFTSDKSTIGLTLSDENLSLPPCTPISLPVSNPYPKTPHPELIFGVASTYERLSSESTLSAFAHWLSHSKSRLILTITDYHSLPSPSASSSSLLKLYHSRSILVSALPPLHPPPTPRITAPPNCTSSSCRRCYPFPPPKPRFSPSSTTTLFSRLCTACRLRWEDMTRQCRCISVPGQKANRRIDSTGRWRLGAGLFVSVPLARQLVPYFERCAVEYGGGDRGGDGLLRDCVYGFTEVRLTEVRGLWQGDLRGDVSGFFEGGRVGRRGGERRGGGEGKYLDQWHNPGIPPRDHKRVKREERGGGAAGGRGTRRYLDPWKNPGIPPRDPEQHRREERGGGAAGGRGTERWRGGEKREDRGGGAAGGRGTGKWDHPPIPPSDVQHLPREERGGGAAGGRGTGKWDHPSLSSRIWIPLTGFLDRAANPSNPHPKHLPTPDLLRPRDNPPSPPLLSLHHYKTWFHAPIPQMSAITSLCGDCFLQRFKTGCNTTTTSSSSSSSSSTVGLWVNGYSYTEFPPGSFPDLQKVEATWQYASSGDYDEAYGPLRPRLGEGQKKQWLLVDAYWTGEGKRKKQFRQLYIYRAPRGKDKKPVDEVLEVVWDV